MTGAVLNDVEEETGFEIRTLNSRDPRMEGPVLPLRQQEEPEGWAEAEPIRQAEEKFLPPVQE